MSFKDTINGMYTLNELLGKLLPDHHIRIHKMFNPAPVSNHWHIEEGRINEDFHLLYVLKGTGTYGFAEQTFQMEAGQTFLVSDGCPHSANTCIDNPVQIYSMRFGIYEQTGSFIPNYSDEPFAIMVHSGIQNETAGLLHRIYKYFLDPGQHSLYACNTLMSQLLLNIAETPASTSGNNIISLITAYIIQQHGMGMDVASLSERTGMSTKHFTRLFQKENGITPHRFIVRTRINHAKFLLEDTSLNVSEIAEALAYPDLFTFSKQFKKLVGLSPTSYRHKI